MTADESARIDGIAGTTTSVLRTLVLSDLVDSTALVERLGDQRAADLIRKHDRVARALMQQHGGREIDKTDGFLLVFERPIQAVAYALAYQRELADLGAQEQIELAARIGIHVGDVVVWDNSADDVRRGAKQTEVEGLVKPVAARLMGLALPRQILMSGTAYDIAHRAQGELGEKLARVRWRTHGRYRLKGVPDLVPVFEVGEEGIAPLRAPAWSGKAHREMPVWRRPLAVVAELLALLLLVAVPAWYFFKPAPAIAFANRDWVVVGSLKNLTGHQVFDDSLEAAFRVGLEQSRYVNVVPQLQVRDALKRMERDPAATAVDRIVGSEIALREGARAVVLPTVAEVGGRVRMTAELVDPHTQTSVYSDSVDAEAEEAMLPRMDELLRKMRGRLGESLASVSEASKPLAQITTGNLDALRALGKAEEEHGRGKVNEALVLLKEALRLDPKFALAWVRLSTLQNAYLGDSHGAFDSLRQAVANRDRLSAREQLFLDGTLSQYEDANRWIDKWTAAAQLYPDAIAARQNLGIGYLWYQHRLAEAQPHFEAIANSRHPLRGASWIALAVIETERGDDVKAMADVAKARELASVMPHFEDVVTDLAARRYDAVSKRLEGMPATLPATIQAEKQLKLAAIAIDQGDDAAAARALEVATQYSVKSTSASQQARVRLASAALRLATRATDAKATLDALIDAETARLAASQPTTDGSATIHLSLAAMMAARSGGSTGKARAGLDASRSIALDHGYYDRSALWQTADCEVRFATKPADRASCLESLVDGREYYQTHVGLWLAYLASDAAAKAEAQQQWLRAHRGQAVAELENEVALIPNLLDARRLPDTQAQAAAATSGPSR
ncbi:MAG: putative peptide modification system cyclase [Dokdonella sp.]|uniref:putative peptide modification system cyclase n=1 Tax=Dokdonella sp. TaxID=2291710 RepID=UPI003F7D0C34